MFQLVVAKKDDPFFAKSSAEEESDNDWAAKKNPYILGEESPWKR